MRAGHSVVDVTPDSCSPESLAGFGKRSSRSNLFGEATLEVSATWIEGTDGGQLLIIVIDSLYIDELLCEEVSEYVKDRYGLPKDRVIFSATHTHSAPALYFEKFGAVDEEYRRQLVSCLKESIEQGHKNIEPCDLTISQVKMPTGLAVNRRGIGRDIKTFFLRPRLIMTPNPSVSHDDLITLIKFTGADKTSLLFGFSCHPVFNSSQTLSSDFPGTLRSLFNKDFAASFFVQGFCGDIRPATYSKKVNYSNWILFLKSLFNRLIFVPPTEKFFANFCESIYDRSMSEIVNEGKVIHSKIFLSQFNFELSSASGNTKRVVTCKLVLIGRLLMISLPAEVNSKYAELVRKKFPELLLLPMGYGEGMFGYMPYSTEVEEGGYEVTSATNYGWDTFLSKSSLENFQFRLLEKIGALVGEDK